MALDEGTIAFNFERAKQQANELDEIANNLSKLATSDFAGTMQNVSVNWKGENARKYLGKGERLQSDMRSTASSLRSVASEIRTVARRIYDAEMYALALAREREYHSS